MAAINCEVFGTELKNIDAIIVNAAGCGAMLKDYGHLLADDPARNFAAKVKDIHEFLMQLGPVPPTHPLPIKAVYHDACHLCHGQQIRQPPRQLLNMIPGLQLLPLPENEICCGAAGSYTLTQPEMAGKLGARKARHIVESGAEAVFTGNVGCILQIGRYLRTTKPGHVGGPSGGCVMGQLLRLEKSTDIGLTLFFGATATTASLAALGPPCRSTSRLNVDKPAGSGYVGRCYMAQPRTKRRIVPTIFPF